MKTLSRYGLVLGGVAAIALGSGAALAQTRIYPEGTDCSKLSTSQQTDCQVQQQNNRTVPGGGNDTGIPAIPAAPGGGTNQDGTLSPNGSSGDTGGSSLGSGPGNGGASPPGQSSN